MNEDEYRTHMSLWCLLAAPLLAGNDLTKVSPAALSLLTNPEVIALDQDPAGIQGHRVAQEGPLEVWVKPLADGSKALSLFNRSNSDALLTACLQDVGVQESVSVRDLWARRDLGSFENSFSATVPRHGVVLVRIKR